MQQTARAPSRFDRIAIVGVGLIGGSIAAAIKARGLAWTVIGAGRHPARLEAARQAGLIDLPASNLTAAARDADLIIFCTPVDRIVAGVREAADSCPPGCTITDVGSVKGPICRDLAGGMPSGVEFIGSHPLAGSEKAGFEFADPQLFAGRVCVLTPVPATTPAALVRLREFWSGLGATVVEMSPAEHDRALAETSHLPHLVAAALAATLSDQNRSLAATGFRDTTRIAAGDPDLWTGIMLANADELLRSFDRHRTVLDELRVALATRDAAALHGLLERARLNREALNANAGNDPVASIPGVPKS